MRAAEWYERMQRGTDGAMVWEMHKDLERLEAQVAAYRKDRLTLIERIHELEESVRVVEDTLEWERTGGYGFTG